MWLVSIFAPSAMPDQVGAELDRLSLDLRCCQRPLEDVQVVSF
jgi:hypothetical protein